MKILCISASNSKNTGSNSISTKVCKLISEVIKEEYDPTAEIEIVPLAEHDLLPCNLCGDCSTTNKCLYDKGFNTIFDKLSTADSIFFVVPHYSPIPSKLIIIFEKINEISYAAWIKDPGYIPLFNNKVTAIIGHGGMVENEEVLKYYHDSLVTPVANALASLSFKIVPATDTFQKGITFGLPNKDCFKKSEEKIFPDIIQDFEIIKEKIKPLIKNTMAEFSVN